MLGGDDQVRSALWATLTVFRWIKNELDLGRAVKIPNMGLISTQTYSDDSIIYFRFDDQFLELTDLMFEEVS